MASTPSFKGHARGAATAVFAAVGTREGRSSSRVPGSAAAFCGVWPLHLYWLGVMVSPSPYKRDVCHRIRRGPQRLL